MSIFIISHQTAHPERHSVELYEEYVDGKLDKENYITAKTSYTNELEDIKTRIEELAAVAVNTEQQTTAPINEPTLNHILNAKDTTPEIISLIGSITIYTPTKITIHFTFTDTNTPN